MEEKNACLNKEYWNLSDIMVFFGCGKNKASQIRKIAIQKYDGFEPILPQKVKKSAVLKAMKVNL